MDQEIQELIDRANFILLKPKKGRQFPEELKNIVAELRNKYNLSVKEISSQIPISAHSARMWPRRKAQAFNKIIIKNKEKTLTRSVTSKNYSMEIEKIILNLKVSKVLIALLIFESIVFHLIFLRIQMVQ